MSFGLIKPSFMTKNGMCKLVRWRLIRLNQSTLDMCCNPENGRVDIETILDYKTQRQGVQNELAAM